MTNTEELFTAIESRRPDRFFVAKRDGVDTLFALHADHSISIALIRGPVTLESAHELLAKLCGYANEGIS